MSITKKNVTIHSMDGNTFNVAGYIVQDIYKEVIKRYNIPYILIYNNDTEDPLKHFTSLIDNTYYYILIPQNELSEIDENIINLKLYNSLITKDYANSIQIGRAHV